MLPFGIGFSEVLVVMVVILLVVGPNKLPDLAKTLGKGVRAARRAGNELKNAINIDDNPYPPPRPWAQADKVADAESELIAHDSWTCDGEGGFDPADIPGVDGTVARSEDDGSADPEDDQPKPAAHDDEQAEQFAAQEAPPAGESVDTAGESDSPQDEVNRVDG